MDVIITYITALVAFGGLLLLMALPVLIGLGVWALRRHLERNR